MQGTASFPLADDEQPAGMLARVRTGSALVTVVGAQGVGKTTWLRRFAEQLGDRAVAVTADSFESEFPLAFADKLVRALGRREGLLDEAGDAFAAARVVLAALAARRRPVLLIDNGQWVDPESARALRYALSRLGDSDPVLVLAGLAPSTAELGELLAGPDPERWRTRATVALRPLDEAQVRAYLAEAHGLEVSLRLAGRIRTRSGGLPVLVDAVVGAMHRSGRAHWDEDVVFDELPANPFAGLGAEWPAVVRVALEILSVLPDGADDDGLAAISAALEERVDADAAVRSGLVERIPGIASSTLRLGHDLIATAIRDGLPSERRREILRAAAGAVANPHRAVGYRIAGAEELDATTREALRTAVAEALERRQFEVALGYLRAAIEKTDGSLRDELIVETCLVAASGLVSQHVVDLLPDLEAMPPDPVRDLALLTTRQITGDIPWALAFVARQFAEPAPHPDRDLIDAQLAMMAVMVQLTTDDYAPLPAQLERVRICAEALRERTGAPHDRRLVPLDDPHPLLLRTAALSLTVQVRIGDPASIGAALLRLNEVIAAAPPSPALVDALVIRASATLTGGDVDRALADLLRAQDVAGRAGEGWSIGHARAAIAQCLWMQGRLDEAKTAADTAVLLSHESVDVSSRPRAYLARALVEATVGDHDGFTASVLAAERVRVTDYDTAGIELELLVAAERARSAGDPEAVLAALDDERLSARFAPALSVLSYRVDALAALGRAEEADRALATIREIEDAGWWPVFGTLDWLAGRVEEAYGFLDRAVRSYETAVRTTRFALPRALAAADAGRVALLLGRRPAGERLLRTAIADLRRIGAAPYLERVLPLLGGVAHAAAPIDSLSRREREIALRAAQGMTNAQIAQALFVSVPTVSFPMRHVLEKPGLRSRRELIPLLLPRTSAAPAPTA